jgi:hypothetical protein
VRWPPRSPDLTPLDFFLWGTIEDKVYQEPPTTAEEMQQHIAACATVSLQTLQSVNCSLIQCFQKCIDANGHHFEQLLL